MLETDDAGHFRLAHLNEGLTATTNAGAPESMVMASCHLPSPLGGSGLGGQVPGASHSSAQAPVLLPPGLRQVA